MGCGRHLDKIYKILVDIDLKAGFPVANFFHTKRLFSFDNNKKQNWILLFLLRKSLRTKAGLIGQANGSKVVYLSADPNAGPFKGRFPLAR